VLLALGMSADAAAQPAPAPSPAAPAATRAPPAAVTPPAGPADPETPDEASAPSAAPAVTDEVIVVTGLRLPRPLHDVPAAITVIDRAQLARSAFTLADDLVRMVPGVGAFRRSSSTAADPTSQGLNLRGLGPSGVSRALALRDGIPLNDPFGGWVYWRALSPLGIERIEVVPSGASALFGDFALGGVMQVLSRPLDARSLDVVVASGSLATGRLAVRGVERLGDVGIELSGEAMRSDGYTPVAQAARGAVDGPAGSGHLSTGLRIEHRHAGSMVHGALRMFIESLDAGTQHTTADVQTVTYDAGWELARGAGTLDAQLFGGQQQFNQERARVSPSRGTADSAALQRTPSDNQGALVTWTPHAWGAHAIVVGLDAQRVAGTATDALTPAALTPSTLTRREAGGEQRFAGVFAEDTIQLMPALALTAAVRLDGWQNLAAGRTLTAFDGTMTVTSFADASELQLDPRLGALVHVRPDVALRASAYRAFRAPTLNELYRPFQVGTVLTAANDRLRPETLWGGELGTQLGAEGLRFQATAFWNRLSDPISNVTLAAPIDGATRQRQNLGRTRVRGLELELVWRPQDAWTVHVAHTFSDAQVIEAPTQPELVGKRLAQDPRHRTTAAVSYHDPQIATLTGEIRYLDRMFEDDLNTLPIGAVALVDARAERSLGSGFAMFVSGQNLFDRHYLVGRAGIDTEGAPRTFELGVAYHAGAP
jgi:outer membrane receptor protein involved in Fe transport